jgi:hypothetical protein
MLYNLLGIGVIENIHARVISNAAKENLRSGLEPDVQEIKNRLLKLSDKKLEALGIDRERVDKFLSAEVKYYCLDILENSMGIGYDDKNNVVRIYYGPRAHSLKTEQIEKMLAHELGHYLYDDAPKSYIVNTLMKAIPSITMGAALYAGESQTLSYALLMTSSLATAHLIGAFVRHREHRADLFADTLMPNISMKTALKGVDEFAEVPANDAMATECISNIFWGVDHPSSALRAGLSDHRLGIKKDAAYESLSIVSRGAAKLFDSIGLKSLAKQMRQFDYTRKI